MFPEGEGTHMPAIKKMMPAADDQQSLLRPKDAADVLGVSERYLSSLARRGELPSVRMGKRAIRYSRADLAAFIDRLRSPHSK
jgi:excisionase family DNA binding protein